MVLLFPLPLPTAAAMRAHLGSIPGRVKEEKKKEEREKERQSGGFFFLPSLVLGPSSEFDTRVLPHPYRLPTGPIKVGSPSKIVKFQFAPLVIRCVTVSLLLQSWGELQHCICSINTSFSFFF